MESVKAYWKPLAAGMAGVVVALVIWHLWVDHVALHQIINMINESARQQTTQLPHAGK